jgi:hypothetical protein
MGLDESVMPRTGNPEKTASAITATEAGKNCKEIILEKM